MKVTYNWLKDFVDIRISPKTLAEKLTMAGLEVTSLESKNGDFLFEIEVTANRPDCLSVIGIAREVAAITGKKLKLDTRSWMLDAGKTKDLGLKIQIEDKKDCPLYTAKIIKDIKVRESPQWLKKRLEMVGCRSVNGVVDISNYILFEWGQPLHAFDLDKLKHSTIVVRRAKDGEKIITIDGQTQQLDEDILVIADDRNCLAIAGIMGGKETEVTQDTKDILLEAAIFNPIIVRRGRQKLGIQSESSYRFERGVDLEMLDMSSQRAVELIQQVCGGKCILAKSSLKPKRKAKSINLDISFIHKILGIKIALLKIKKILNNLGFKIKSQTKKNFIVSIPSYRQDVNWEIDLIEEIARIFGYDHIAKTIPALTPQVTADKTKSLVSLVKSILVGLGLNEVITYSLTGRELWHEFKLSRSRAPIEILNPLSQDQTVLRPTLMPSLARCLAHNLNQNQEHINIFEIAKTFGEFGSRPQEELKLGIALCGIKSLLTLDVGLVKTKMGPLNLKGIIEILFERLGIKDYSFRAQADVLEVGVDVNEQEIGIMLKPEDNILEKFDIRSKDIWFLELSLDRLFSYVDLKKKFVSLPLYPAISRDISFVLKEGSSLDNILKAIKEKGRPLLSEVKIVDYYKGKQIPAGFKGITLSCVYRLAQRTLTDSEVDPVHSLICRILKETFSAQIR